MDILIKNMELPRTVTMYPNGDIDELVDGKYVTIGKAIELPPHGRLIDADDLANCYADLEADNGEYTEDAGKTLTTIQNAPTVLEAST